MSSGYLSSYIIAISPLYTGKHIVNSSSPKCSKFSNVLPAVNGLTGPDPSDLEMNDLDLALTGP